jgi:hypothetical protein
MNCFEILRSSVVEGVLQFAGDYLCHSQAKLILGFSRGFLVV